MDNSTLNKYVGILLGVGLIIWGLSIAIGGDYYSFKYGRVFEFGGFHVPFELFMSAVGIGFLIVSIRIRKKQDTNNE